MHSEASASWIYPGLVRSTARIISNAAGSENSCGRYGGAARHALREGKRQKEQGKRQKEGRGVNRQQRLLINPAPSLLPFGFCLLPFALRQGYSPSRLTRSL
jgi:hypothetical protein